MEFNKSNDLNDFLFKLEQRKPTSSMMIWMKFYDQICDRICCHSTDCGSIRCSGCLNYLTGCPPSTRYQCIDCDILPPETVNNPRPELCEKCFINPLMLHHHANWLKVDLKGIHSLEERKVGVAELKELKISDFTPINLENEKDISSDICIICNEGFTLKNPAVSYPGCKKQHGSPISDKNLGVVDSKQFFHAECLMTWFEISKRNTYCGDLSTNYCDVCRFHLELKAWKRQFQTIKNNIDNFFDCENLSLYYLFDEIEKQLTINFLPNEKKDIINHLEIKDNINKIKNQICDIIIVKLSEMHKQEWLRKVIKEVFFTIS